MQTDKRLAPTLAWLLPILGWLWLWLQHRDDQRARQALRESLALWLAIIGALIAWALFAWLVTWLPFVGPLIALASFSLVLVAWLLCAVLWLTGLQRALRSDSRPLPLLGRIVQRLPL